MDQYRSLAAWQHAHDLVIQTLRALGAKRPPASWPVFDQLGRAVVSTEANVVEGYALKGLGYYRKHIRIALGSAAEAECLINVARELEYLPADTCDVLHEIADRAVGSLYGLARALEKQG